jgi:hypothetical protein
MKTNDDAKLKQAKILVKVRKGRMKDYVDITVRARRKEIFIPNVEKLKEEHWVIKGIYLACQCLRIEMEIVDEDIAKQLRRA